MIAKAIFASFA